MKKYQTIGGTMVLAICSIYCFARQDNGNKHHKPSPSFTAKFYPKDTTRIDTTKPQVKLPPPKQDTTKN